jgi:hypothetical protein
MRPWISWACFIIFIRSIIGVPWRSEPDTD